VEATNYNDHMPIYILSINTFGYGYYDVFSEIHIYIYIYTFGLHEFYIIACVFCILYIMYCVDRKKDRMIWWI